ncbi:EF-hand domain-containing protein [Oscillatoria amoena NRMC-F 0135]|uniref:EF-hand domain-containing protein n=1 Tax=Geitlerinema calcuttense NRMC-F 0142 TaxID=2922238 RepID=A0ABT7LZN3_9CYAN|nr:MULTISPECIES: EF-hand domain-containing protein [Cyanophyceae]MDL5050395.1 EF-hand domain-containing protein [Oscillatoria amoena NRMC-F 0135]MDL5054208.1 EF-hand domain-containing protein [Oscillatoria laete-virens NRMC-F 0139]MDL5057457.1 EF-hand domain-containing protein [Geitlerinema calcuttense NRMC-F 0142]
MKQIALIVCAGLFIAHLTASESSEPAAPEPTVDANQDGKVSHEEFATHHAREVFTYYDVDGDGKITKKEVEQIHQENPAHAGAAKATLKHPDIDKNKDGVITPDELEQAAKKSPDVKTLFHGISENAPKDNWVNQAEYDSWAGDTSFDPEGQGLPVMSISF